jgi:hypothetical protein
MDKTFFKSIKDVVVKQKFVAEDDVAREIWENVKVDQKGTAQTFVMPESPIQSRHLPLRPSKGSVRKLDFDPMLL